MAIDNDSIDKIDDAISRISQEDIENNGVTMVVTDFVDDDVLVEDKIEKTLKIDNIENLDENNENDKTVVIENLDSIENVKSSESDVESSNFSEINQDSVLHNSLENSENLNNFNDKKIDKSKLIIIVLIISIIITLLFAVLLFVDKSKKNNNFNHVDKNDGIVASEINDKEVINDYGKTMEKVIRELFENDDSTVDYDQIEYKTAREFRSLSKYNSGEYNISCGVHEFYIDKTVYLDKCVINNHEVKYSYGKKKDSTSLDELKPAVYVSKKDSTATFEKPYDYSLYDTYYLKVPVTASDFKFLDKDNSSFISYVDVDGYHIINYKDSRKALSSFDYSDIMPIYVSEKFSGNVAIKKNDKWGFYVLETRRRLIDHVYDDINEINADLHVINLDNLDKVVVKRGEQFGVYNLNIEKEIVPTNYDNITIVDKYYKCSNSSRKDFYSETGDKILVNYKIIYDILDDTAIVMSNNTVKIVNIDGNVLADSKIDKVGNYLSSKKYYDDLIFMFNDYKNDNVSCVNFIYNKGTKKVEIKDISCE